MAVLHRKADSEVEDEASDVEREESKDSFGV